MSYERCVACGSNRLSPVTSLGIDTTSSTPRANFDLKNPPKGFLATSTKHLYVDRVCVCADCGFTAFFVSEKFDPATLVAT